MQLLALYTMELHFYSNGPEVKKIKTFANIFFFLAVINSFLYFDKYV
jgi:hypothetical protein